MPVDGATATAVQLYPFPRISVDLSDNLWVTDGNQVYSVSLATDTLHIVLGSAPPGAPAPTSCTIGDAAL